MYQSHRFASAGLALLTASLLALSGCSDPNVESLSSAEAIGSTPESSAPAESQPASSAASARPTQDREGNPIQVPETLNRIISTVPSNTEIIIDLGSGDLLVAVDVYSNDVEGLDPSLPQMDFYNPDGEAILELSPDLILASGHNKIGEDDPFALLEDAGVCVAYIPSSSSVQGVCDDLLFVGQLLGKEAAAQALVDDYQKQIDEIRAIAATIPEEERKTVYFEIDPMYSFGGGTFLNEFIELIGAKNVFADQQGWLSVEAESLIAANPDVILTNVSYIEDPIGDIKGRDGFGALDAVKNDAIYSIDTNSSSRPNHRSITALKQMAKAVYPEYYE